MSELFYCIVCGWRGLEEMPIYPFGSFEICPCCGTEYGLDVLRYEDIQSVRQRWLDEGAPWFDDFPGSQDMRPKEWSVDIARAQISKFEQNKL